MPDPVPVRIRICMAAACLLSDFGRQLPLHCQHLFFPNASFTLPCLLDMAMSSLCLLDTLSLHLTDCSTKGSELYIDAVGLSADSAAIRATV